jgi:hypothetical protein
MAHMDLGVGECGLPGIHAPTSYRERPRPARQHLSELARLMGEVAQVLARGPRSLTPGECELVAAYVAGTGES